MAITEHSIAWEFWDDSVSAALVCHAPEGSLCRTTPECDCETYSDIGQDEQGWFHTAYNGDFDIDDPESEEEVTHRHHPSKGCNYMEWINADGPMECAQRDERFSLGETPVELVWEGDFYSWKRAEAVS